MKQNKTISLDTDICSKLRNEENASFLINRLIKEFYDGNDLKKMTTKQLKMVIAQEQLKKKHKAELEALNE
tara:strand:+ start:259 stop:471 length:213 start_codon:yes stop_codon:yes gene_type:complete